MKEMPGEHPDCHRAHIWQRGNGPGGLAASFFGVANDLLLMARARS